MVRHLDEIEQGLNEYADDVREEPRWDYYPETRHFTFELDAVKRGIKVPEQKASQLRNLYFDFLKRVYERAGFADERSGRGDTRESRTKYLEQFEKDIAALQKMEQLLDKTKRLFCSDYDGPKGRGFPDLDLFENYILPCAASLAETPEELDLVFQDALTSLEDLMVTKFYATSSSGVSYRFYEAFFDHPPKSPYGGSHAADSDFHYYYDHFGRKFAMLVAAIQGKQEDEHYDGGSYSFKKYQINERVISLFECIPPAYHDQVLDVAINIARNGRYEAVVYFLDKIDRVIAAFSHPKDEKLLGDYFELCKHNRVRILISGSLMGEKKKFESPLPFFLDPEAAVNQMKALQRFGHHKRTVMEMATFIMDNSGCFDHYDIFFTGSEHGSYDAARINFTGIVQRLREAGKTEAEIGEILSMSKTHPWLGDLVAEICDNYDKYDREYPGGIKEMFAYLQKIRTCSEGMRRYMHNFNDLPWGSPFIEDYLSIGEELAAAFPRSLSFYFPSYNKQAIEQIFQNIEGHGKQKFFDVISRLKATAERFSGLTHYELLERVLEFIFRFLIGDPRLNDLLDALNIIATSNADNGERRDYFAEREVVDGYNFLLGGAINGWVEEGRIEHEQYSADIRDLDMGPSAKVLGDYIRVCRNLNFHNDLTVLDLIRQGFDPRMAIQNSFSAMRRFETSYHEAPTFAGLNYLCELYREQGPIAVKEVADTVFECRRAIAGVLQNRRTSSCSMIFDENEEFEESVIHLNSNLRRLDEAMMLPQCSNVKELAELQNEMRQAQQVLLFRELVGGQMPALIQRKKIQSPLLQQGSSTTRVILAGAALMSAIGALDVPGCKAKQLPQAEKIQNYLLTVGSRKERRQELTTVIKQYQDEIQARLTETVPVFEQLILEARKQAPGLMAEGGKIHTTATMDTDLINYVQDLFGLDSKSFHLIRAGQTLNLPPMVTEYELQLLMTVLARFGVLDVEKPDLQLTMAGRLPDELAGISAISTLLSTDAGILYEKGAFKTTHDHLTGARIMAYDDGVKIEGLPYDRKSAEGRTDILGRQSVLDSRYYRVVHCLLADMHYGEMFANIGRRYTEDFFALMKKHNLGRLVRATTWVFSDRNSAADTLENHERIIRQINDVWYRASEEVDFGIVGEMRGLITDYYDKIRGMRSNIIEANPDEYQRYLNF